MQEEHVESIRQRPAEVLRPYIAWYTGYRQTGGAPGLHRGLPSPFVTLIFTLDDPVEVAVPSDPRQAPHAYATLVGGLHTTPTIISHAGRQSGIQLALEPLGARALLGLPAAEVANIDVPASDVLGPLSDELHTRIRSARTWAERFAVLDALLARRLDPRGQTPSEVVHAWRALKESGGTRGVAELADDVGYTPRYFRQRFLCEIGLSPKAAARVIRFDRVRKRIQRNDRGESLARLAAECGYYDHAHLAREFREIAGCSARQWYAEEFRNIQVHELDEPAD
jgi:AraC-like DNA-binding protein